MWSKVLSAGMLSLAIACCAGELHPDFRPAGAVISRQKNALHLWEIPEKAELLKITPRGRGVLFQYSGSSADAFFAYSQPAAVRKGAYLRLDYHLTKHRWSYASSVPVFVEFLDQKK